MDILTTNPDSDREALPVFSFEEEAETFLRLGLSEPGWQARKTTAGELISVLYGSCTGIRKVALDPLPAEVDGEMMVDLVSLSRERFVRALVGERGPRGSTRGQEIPDETIKEVDIPDYVMWDFGHQGVNVAKRRAC